MAEARAVAQRRDVEIPSGEAHLAAWLYDPAGAAGSSGSIDLPAPGRGGHPCVVMAHGMSATRDLNLAAFAERFAAAGFAALVFDYRYFGDSGGEPRQLLDIDRQLEDWKAAVTYAREIEGVDPGRIALWGTSFAGGHVVQTASEDHRIAAVIAQVPFADGRRLAGGASRGTLVKLVSASVYDAARGKLGLGPFYIPVLGQRGSLAALTDPDSAGDMTSLIPAGSKWRNSYTPRVSFRIRGYQPFLAADSVECPLLVCVCENDQVTPPGPALEMADRAPHGESLSYPGKHFEIYAGELFERAVADQTAFLARTLEPV